MRLRLSSNRALSVAERRDPSAATMATRFQSPGTPQVAEWDAEQAIRYAYLANVIVWRCVTLIGQDVSSCAFRVGTDPDKQREFDTKAPLAKLLGPPPFGPAPRISARRLWANAVAQYLVTGRFGWEIETDGRNRISALWPLVSSQLRAIPTERGIDWFSGFEYGPVSKKKKLQSEQVFYFWRPSLTDWRQPESALQSARLDISVAVMQDRYDYAFIKNDARPASIIVHEAFAEIEERDRWRQQFMGDYKGPDEAGKPYFVETELDGDQKGVTGAIDVKTLGLSQHDAEFIRRHEAKLRNIAIGLGVPFSKLDASGRTFSNAGEENRNYWIQTILPLLLDLQDAVNMDLAERTGDGKVGWFDTSHVEALRPVRKFQNLNAVQLIQEQVISKDELREDVYLEPLPDGKGELPDDEEEEEPEPPPPPPLLVPVPTEEEGVTATAANIPEPEVRQVDHEERRTTIWRSVDKQVKSLEKMWARQWKSHFRKQLQAAISRLEGKRGRQAVRQGGLDARGIFDPSFWEQETREFVSGLYESVVTVAGARVAERFGISFDVEAAFAQEFVAARSNQLSGKVTATTYDAIKAEMAEGVGLGEDIPTIAKRIQEVFAQATKMRSTRIARTEVISAFNGSSTEVMRNLGQEMVGGQEWIATVDGRVRASHAEADGQVVALGQMFMVGGYSLEYPGDPAGPSSEVVNCRCTVAFLTPEEMAERGNGRVELRTVERLFARLAIGKLRVEDFERELAS
jgi:HK97 family phage portal protein